MDELLIELNNIKFPKQERNNIKNFEDEEIRGFVLGLVNLRAFQQKKYNSKTIISAKTKKQKYKYIHLLARNIMLKEDNIFEYTTIQFNKNHQCAKHKDKKNQGVSYIVGLGDYTGGRLIVYDEDGNNPEYIDIKNKFYKFDGSKYPHETEPFEGERYSLVYFNI